MSVSQMLETLKTKIVETIAKLLGLRADYANDPKEVDRILEKDLSMDTLRAQTDSSAESIVSRGSLQQLVLGLVKISQLAEKDNIISIINKTNFDSFRQYILNRYTGEEDTKLRKGLLRQDHSFTLHNRVRDILSRKGTLVEYLEAVDRVQESHRDVLIFKNIDYDSVVGYYIDYLAYSLPNTPKADLALIKKNLNAGHLAGIFNARFLKVFNASVDQTTSKISNKGIDPEVGDMLQKVLDLLQLADYLSLNVINDVGLFIQLEKLLTKRQQYIKVVTEIQVGADNKKAGNLLSTAGRHLNDVVRSMKASRLLGKLQEASRALEKFLKSLSNVSSYIKTREAELKNTPGLLDLAKEKIQQALLLSEAIDTYINTKGSQSLLEFIILDISGTVIDTPNLSKLGSTVVRVLKKLPVKKKLSNSTKIVVPKLKKLIDVSIPKTQQLRNLKGRFTSLTNLQNLLNQRLHDQIKANMGTGSARNVLNYRSGRFAQSAKVERISEGREGMITAFYTYMKYPYATFSEGGRQQYPKTRDPKLLIAKSIREIAGTSVSNRMRLVNI